MRFCQISLVVQNRTRLGKGQADKRVLIDLLQPIGLEKIGIKFSRAFSRVQIEAYFQWVMKIVRKIAEFDIEWSFLTEIYKNRRIWAKIDEKSGSKISENLTKSRIFSTLD